jgi:AbrB family looped-hinge helix DNA binding protein
MKIENVKSRLNANGRIVIPSEIRKRMGLNPGDDVLMTLDDGVLKIESQLARIQRIQEEFKPFTRNGLPASDVLVAERREEAVQEAEEWLG